MIPYSYNMVDMGGIDLAEANGTVVPGVYEKIVEAMNLCGDLILYNWKFAGINIVPSTYAVLQQANSILINGLIQVTELDQITVIGLPPPLVPVVPLEVVENGLYEAEPPESGFNPVQVSVPERVPIIESISITENGIYSVPEGVDGYAPVTVNVSGGGDLPDQYQRVLYVESNGTQYIDTGVLASSDLSAKVIALVLNKITAADVVVGTRSQSGGYMYRYIPVTITENITSYRIAYGDIQFMQSADHEAVFELNDQSGNIKIDGTTLGNISSATFQASPNNICIFACGDDNSTPSFHSIARVYRCDFSSKSTGNALRSFIPCKRKADGVVGFYDIVGELFYTNQGSGSLTAGPEI